MKKYLSLFSVFFLSILPLIAQNDLQWLIYNGKGKRGTIDATTNNYYYSYVGPAEFNLEGITHPDVSYYGFVRNDVFIIYADATYYNSRLKIPSATDHGFFYNSDLTKINHHFIPTHTSPILYLYLSNIYEQDDPPKNVKARTGAGSGGSDTFTIPLGTSVDPIFADHDVVQNTDITLILDNNLIRQAALASGLTVGTDFQYVVHFNAVESKTDAAEKHEGLFFVPRPIFTTASGAQVGIFPTSCGTYVEDATSLTITHNCSPFVYINLRPSSSLAPYYPGEDGEPDYKATFSITSTSGTPITSLNEDIRSSHDPNFIRIDSICKDDMGNQIVFCHIQFENTGSEEPGTVDVSFNLPESADNTCFEIMDWYLGGPAKPGVVDRKGFKVMCHFNMKGANFVKCYDPADTTCIGYINFKYKIGSAFNLQNTSTDIWVKSPNVFFDGDRYPIKLYKDLTDIQYHGQSFSGYYRPVIAKHDCSVECSGL